MSGRFNVDLLDPNDPFELDEGNLPHLFSHPYSVDDLYDMWFDDPLYYPADKTRGDADWFLVAAIPGDTVLVAPLAPPKSGEYTKARPIGVYKAPVWLDTLYRNDRR